MKISRLPLLFPLMVAVTVHAATERTPEQEATIKKVMNYVTGKLETIPQVPLRHDLNEFVIDGESEAVKEATEAIVKTVIDRAYTGETNGIAKGDHGKSQACLTGTMSVAQNLPLHLQQGVIVPGATYQIESRLSNAEHPGASDKSSVSQGVALKLKNVSSVTGNKARLPDFPSSDEQDFLMTSAPIFFLSNIVEYNKAFQVRAEGGAGNFWRALKSNPSAMLGRLSEGLIAKMRASGWISKGTPPNMLTHAYWSKHPYAWGEKGGDLSVAAKYSVAPAPCDNNFPLTKKSTNDEFQKQFIKEAFDKNGEICFYFRVQTRPPHATERAYPMEDANVEWSEDKAPFINVALIKFKAADNTGWSTDAKEAACGKTEFNPWNGLMAHQPLSNLSRGRRYVYKASALVRESQKDIGVQVPHKTN